MAGKSVLALAHEMILPAGDIDHLSPAPSGKNLGLIMTVKPLAKIGVQ